MAGISGISMAPHACEGPIGGLATLHVDASTPNFLIQENFDMFNDAWTHDLVTWAPALDPATGHFSLPTAPGLGLKLNLDVARAHPYDPHAYLNVFAEGWEKRLGTASAPTPRPRRKKK